MLQPSEVKTLTRQDTGNAEFDRQYAEGSSRLANEGLIGVRYRLPKAVAMLAEQYRDAPPMDVLEIGAGIGEVAKLLRRSGLRINRYVGIEYSYHATRRLRERGYTGAQMNAEQLAFADNSFDLVFCFDVMHHVNSPRLMAHEMVRVTRKHFLLSEPNHLSFVRRLGEIHPGARARGERSFTPAEYRSFFPAGQVDGSIDIRPFYVLVPPKTPRRLIPYVIQVSEVGQRIPGVRWIGQSLLIVGQKKPQPAAAADGPSALTVGDGSACGGAGAPAVAAAAATT